MKIKVGNWKVDSKTLIELKFDGRLPKLYVHEKFEKPLKWIIWIVSLLSFITIFIAIKNYFISVGIGLGIFSLSFILDRAIVKYTTLVVQPFPDFKVDYSQWYNVMTVSDPDYKKNVNMVGFIYNNLDYGKKFFNYIKGWNFGNIDDSNCNIILSIVEEDNGAFTFYLYANPNRKNLDLMFKEVELDNFLAKSKKNKVQEQLVMEMAYWHTIDYKNDKHIRDFIKNQPTNEKFMFIPVQRTDHGFEMGLESQIILSGYRYNKRQDLHKYSNENYYSEMEINNKNQEK